jgi:Xaa-Pro dipeptidase
MKPPHQQDLLGQDAVDFERRVEIPRLKRERLQRLREQIVAADLGGVLLFDPVNIRYATGTRGHVAFTMRHYDRYALISPESRVVLFSDSSDTSGEDDDLEVREGLVWDYFPCGRNSIEAARRWAVHLKDAMQELGITGQKLGIDRLDYTAFAALNAEGLQLADARVPIEKARAIKTADELVLIRQACAVADVGVAAVREAIQPGVTENDLWAILTAVNIRHGGEYMDGRMLSSGGRTNPWYQPASDRLVRDGELVALDTDMAGPMGYFADISRTYLCGDRPPTPEQRELYSVGYEFIQQTIPLFKPGALFPDIAAQAPEFPDVYKANRYILLAHGVGMSDEWPSLYFPDVSWSGFGNDPDQVEENMVICVEALVGKENGNQSVKLEEQIIVTARGPEVISSAPFDWRFVG